MQILLKDPLVAEKAVVQSTIIVLEKSRCGERCIEFGQRGFFPKPRVGEYGRRIINGIHCIGCSKDRSPQIPHDPGIGQRHLDRVLKTQ